MRLVCKTCGAVCVFQKDFKPKRCACGSSDIYNADPPEWFLKLRQWFRKLRWSMSTPSYNPPPKKRSITKIEPKHRRRIDTVRKIRDAGIRTQRETERNSK